MVQKELLRSQDWKALSNSERIAWIHLKASFKGYGSESLSLTYASMRDIMAAATLSKALKGLIEKGWVEKTQHGGLYRYYCTYRLVGPWSKLPG